MNGIRLTQKGKEVVSQYIREAEVRRKDILDMGIDTADETDLPDEESILQDIEFFEDEDNEYYNSWGVTDNYDAGHPLFLKRGIHYIAASE